MNIYTKLSLRPTRIGFLVHPADKRSLEKIIRVNTSLWGGVFNPIIPVFSRPPKCWEDDHKTDRSYGATKGYINYFEPDVFVEAENGLAEKVGIPLEFQDKFHAKTVGLNGFWENKSWGDSGPRFGISIAKVLKHNYATERKFVLRQGHQEHFQTYAKPNQRLAALAMFGGYLKEDNAKHLMRDYHHVFEPSKAESLEDAWQKRIFEHYASELALTADGLEPNHFGVKQPIFFLFDPNSSHDLIDYWNLRAQALGRVYPVPLNFWADFKGKLQEFALKFFQPATKNRFERGVTIELSRSIASRQVLHKFENELKSWTKGLATLKPWRDPVWQGHSQHHSSAGVEVSRPYAVEKNTTIKDDDETYLRFTTIAPEFADGLMQNEYSWVNVLKIADSHHHSKMATTLPFNVLRNFRWRLTMFDKTIVNSEGWCLPQRYSDNSELLEKRSAFDCFEEFFKKTGLSLRRSEAGIIAEQMFGALSEEVSGLVAVGIFASAERLKFFNRYAMRQRILSNATDVIEESFPTKSISLKAIEVHVKKYGREGVSRKSLVERLVACKVIQLGIGVSCPHCFNENWFDLDAVSYSLVCDLCRKNFRFPEHRVEKGSGNWKYLLIGPFATPDYARGSYSGLLTARLLNEISDDHSQLTFCPGLELTSSTEKHEADLVCWLQEKGKFGVLRDPKLVFAECKSFATEALKAVDFSRMASLANRFPDAALVFSVLKNELSDKEKALACVFLKKNAGQLQDGYYERSVLFLTGKDLFFDYFVSGEDTARYSYNELDAISDFAAATQRLNLNLHT